MALLDLLISNLGTVILCLPTAIILCYVIYQRHFHPLSQFPGPFLASITDLWQAYQYLTLQQPYNLTELHERYGPFVRYGPDKLSTTSESAIILIYQKEGRHMPKTEFYDAFGSAHPNVFGVRDEQFHSVRRRHMSHSFSMASVKDMEQYLDLNIGIMKQKLEEYASTGQAFDLRKILQYYVVDTLGELAFSRSFGVQVADDESLVPPVAKHGFLGAVMGSVPSMIPTLKKWLPRIPYQPLQDLFRSRMVCAKLASDCVQRRFQDLDGVGDDEKGSENQRKDLLTSLVLARHPDTGERLTQTDLETEAFGFIIAGTHTTSATTTLLFHHLLHKPAILSKLTLEIDINLPPLDPDQSAHSITTLESALPYLRNCIKENYRINPVFTLPLARRVTSPEGITIDDQHIPPGTSIAVCNHAFHHNPAVWGQDHNAFRPERWDEEETSVRSRLLMHFGLGGRQCLGKTIAMTNIYKIVSSLVEGFEFELVEVDAGRAKVVGSDAGKEKASGGEGSDLPPLINMGLSELEGPLMVKCKRRSGRVGGEA